MPSTNSSAFAGYLTPTSAPPANDFDLSDQLNELIAGVTGIPGQNVRPRYQPRPPVIPAATTDWIAFGDITTDTLRVASPIKRHYSDGDGHDELRQDTLLTVLVSAYGPNSKHYSELLRDGLFIDQNFDVARTRGLKLQEIGTIRHVPELINDIWYRRYDMELLLKREVVRSYAVLNILSSQGTLVGNEEGHEYTWNTELVDG